jgi:two-component system response regulator AtoC
VGGNAPFSGLVGTSAPMQRLFKELGKVAGSRAAVLIEGESGTGKELIARVLHSYGQPPGEEKPFVAVNCSALVETLLESELFGHEKGAFTGAVQTKPGRFELAGEGTIFLDEIGELSPNLQAKLLRVLQEREFERVGGTRTLPVKARIVAATHRDLAFEVRSARFRTDLYQRLKVVTLRVPALRERREDIPLLVEHLLGRINQRLHKNLRRVPRAAVARLQKREWPGNVRELENVLTRAAVLSQGDVLLDEHLREAVEAAGEPGPDAAVLVGLGAAPPPAEGRRSTEPAPPTLPTLEDLERQHIARVFRVTGGHRGHTCRILGISRPTLERKLRKYDLLD